MTDERQVGAGLRRRRTRGCRTPASRSPPQPGRRRPRRRRRRRGRGRQDGDDRPDHGRLQPLRRRLDRDLHGPEDLPLVGVHRRPPPGRWGAQRRHRRRAAAAGHPRVAGPHPHGVDRPALPPVPRIRGCRSPERDRTCPWAGRRRLPPAAASLRSGAQADAAGRPPLLMRVRVRRLGHAAGLPLPARASAGSAGLDLRAAVAAPHRPRPRRARPRPHRPGARDPARLRGADPAPQRPGRSATA